ncbi:MAG: serpin family protein [Phycisphaerae bacterium]|nr:serpin family protein [Phycisphaerae bacterium]
MPHSLFLALALLAAPSVLGPTGVRTPNPSVQERAPDRSVESVAVAASNAFGVDLFRTMATASPGGNLFVSPLSIAMALAMTAEGSKDQTAQEMATVLHVPNESAKSPSFSSLHQGFAALSNALGKAGGMADAATEARIAELRAALESANTKTKSLEREGSKWDEVAASQREAQRLADELNAILFRVNRFDLRVANALWVERSYPLSGEFAATIDRFYGSGATNELDIAGDVEGSRARINGWVEAKTEGRIQELIPRGALTPVMRLVITNAIYFKGEWSTPFAESNTRLEPFTRSDGTTIDVHMMNDATRVDAQYAAFSGNGEYFDTPMQVPLRDDNPPATYPDDGGFQVLQIPYKGGDLAMVVVLPRRADGLDALVANLSPQSLESWLARLGGRTVNVGLPRFTVEKEIELSDSLKSLGMTRAFARPDLPNGAQFPGMNPSSNPAQQLYVGAALHKAWIAVSERGTEAAAATAVLMAPGRAVQQPPTMVPFTPIVRADHPFLFLIRETRTGAILFMGRMSAP